MSESNASIAGAVPDNQVETPAAERPLALRISNKLEVFVDLIGRFGSWFIMPVVIITCFDVIARKAVWTNSEGMRVGIQIWLVETFGRLFDSTLLQELEWHSHTALFALVLSYGYIKNTHVRVDLVRERLHFRTKAWLEFVGLTIFLFPFTLTIIYFSAIYAYDSWVIGEISASQVGLSHRWIIKSVLVFGLVMILLAGLSVWLQVFTVLFGPQHMRYPLMTLEWPEEEGTRIEGKERLDLQKVEDALEKKARELGHIDEEPDVDSGKSDSGKPAGDRNG